MFTLSEDVAAVGVQAKWIDHLVSCGLRAARYASKLEDKQLVLALSVPQRDYAAALIACGWVLGAKRPNVSDPRRVLERVEPGQKVCLTDKKHIVAAKFFRVETKREGRCSSLIKVPGVSTKSLLLMCFQMTWNRQRFRVVKRALNQDRWHEWQVLIVTGIHG